MKIEDAREEPYGTCPMGKSAFYRLNQSKYKKKQHFDLFSASEQNQSHCDRDKKIPGVNLHHFTVFAFAQQASVPHCPRISMFTLSYEDIDRQSVT